MNLSKQEEAELRTAQEILNRVFPKLEPELIPFPENYVIKKWTEVVVVEDELKEIPSGLKGKTIESGTTPVCDFDIKDYDFGMYSQELAPLHPEEHPNHPNFKLSAGDYVKIIQEGVSEDLTGKIIKLTKSNLERLTPTYHFNINKYYHFRFPDQARFCTDAEIQEFEEANKPKPIPEGTLCLVADYANRMGNFSLRYSDGKGNHFFQEKSDDIAYWKHSIPLTPEMQKIVEDYVKNNQ